MFNNRKGIEGKARVVPGRGFSPWRNSYTQLPSTERERERGVELLNRFLRVWLFENDSTPEISRLLKTHPLLDVLLEHS